MKFKEKTLKIISLIYIVLIVLIECNNLKLSKYSKDTISFKLNRDDNTTNQTENKNSTTIVNNNTMNNSTLHSIIPLFDRKTDSVIRNLNNKLNKENDPPKRNEELKNNKDNNINSELDKTLSDNYVIKDNKLVIDLNQMDKDEFNVLKNKIDKRETFSNEEPDPLSIVPVTNEYYSGPLNPNSKYYPVETLQSIHNEVFPKHENKYENTNTYLSNQRKQDSYLKYPSINPSISQSKLSNYISAKTSSNSNAYYDNNKYSNPIRSSFTNSYPNTNMYKVNTKFDSDELQNLNFLQKSQNQNLRSSKDNKYFKNYKKNLYDSVLKYYYNS